MIEDQSAIRDIKCAWLASLETMGLSLSRLRRDAPTICRQEKPMSRISRLDIASMLSAEKALEDLRLRLMDSWDIKQNELLEWMDLDPDAYAKRMTLKGYTVSHSPHLRDGQIKKLRRRCT